MRGGAELLGGSHVIISMQAAISMQMPGSGPGGAVVHNTPGQGSTHRLQCTSHYSFASVGAEGEELWSSVG